jgi:hypothetical protein
MREVNSQRMREGRPTPRAHADYKVGAVFGRLTLMERAGATGADGDRRALWRCACECGGSMVASTRHLRSGVAQSCGCKPNGSTKPKGPAPAVGVVFGLLTVLRDAGVDSQRKRWWLCRCECGAEKKVTTGNLAAGCVKSCGCLSRSTGLKATRMSINPGQRMPAGSIGAWPKTSPRKEGKADDRPAWRPQTEYKALSAPAERATGPKVTVRELPRHDLRFGIDPATRVVGGFASMGIGRYLEVAA